MLKSKSKSLILSVFVALGLGSCTTTIETEAVESSVSSPDFYEFYESEFFHDVQMAGIFPDSKTFVDATPKNDLDEIVSKYAIAKSSNDFDLESFVKENFHIPQVISSDFETDTTKTMKEHIERLWPVLTRQPDEYEPMSSLVPLPYSYIVPGGRFREIYYWDSYFTMEGLMLSGKEEMVKNMIDNFSFLLDTLGFIPNGNRVYYKGRSQPPFYALMVSLLAEKNRDLFLSYHDNMIKEYNFWMKNADRLDEGNPTMDRVVRMPDGSILNRYWDAYAMPRPESYKEDYELIHENNLPAEEAYRHLRAGAESGWDYSSRWFKDKENLETINTTNVIPVDLNALLYFLELKIAQGYNWSEDLEMASLYLDKATARKEAIDKYLWSDQEGFYMDFDLTTGQSTGVYSLAAAYPLYFQMATKNQAKRVKEKLEKDFLKGGGFVSTTNTTGEQWDSPNGWAPLQWITINALYNYDFDELGNTGLERWLERNREVYQATGKMMEKYNVVDTDLLAGGGEYALQDGFGWTNGIALAFINIMEKKKLVEEMME